GGTGWGRRDARGGTPRGRTARCGPAGRRPWRGRSAAPILCGATAALRAGGTAWPPVVGATLQPRRTRIPSPVGGGIVTIRTPDVKRVTSWRASTQARRVGGPPAGRGRR